MIHILISFISIQEISGFHCWSSTLLYPSKGIALKRADNKQQGSALRFGTNYCSILSSMISFFFSCVSRRMFTLPSCRDSSTVKVQWPQHTPQPHYPLSLPTMKRNIFTMHPWQDRAEWIPLIGWCTFKSDGIHTKTAEEIWAPQKMDFSWGLIGRHA